jgi:hypothetical protein
MRVHDRVLDADVRDWRVPHVRKQLGAFPKLIPHLVKGLAGRRLVKPSHAAISKADVWRVSDDQKVPSIIQYLSNVALNMAVAVVLSRQQVAGPRNMAFFQKRIPHDSREFAGNEDSQDSRGWASVVDW